MDANLRLKIVPNLNGSSHLATKYEGVKFGRLIPLGDRSFSLQH